MIILHLFLEFFKIGLFTFGGGYAMIPLIQKEVVDNRHWLTIEQFADVVVISEMTPGPFAVNSATFIGYRVGGFWGAVFGTLGVVLPSFLIILAIVTTFLSFRENPVVRSAFRGLRPAVLALILVAAYSIGKIAVIDYKSVVILALVVTGILVFKIHPIMALVASALIGIIFLK
ncbi:MAG: chromate transporter [Candidatus Omnitrophota bacterium]